MKGLGSEHEPRSLRTGSQSPSQSCTVLTTLQWCTMQVRAASFPVRPVYCITIHQSSPNPTCNSCPARECSPQAAETVDRPHPGWLQTKDMEIRFILHASFYTLHRSASRQRGNEDRTGSLEHPPRSRTRCTGQLSTTPQHSHQQTQRNNQHNTTAITNQDTRWSRNSVHGRGPVRSKACHELDDALHYW